MTSDDLKKLAQRAQFDLCAVTKADKIDQAADRFQSWLDHGYQSEMDWLARNVERRTDPGQLGIDAKSVIMLGVNYFQPNSEPVPVGHGRVSRYARGRDYHKVIATMIKQLLKLIETRHPETRSAQFKWWVDYGPFMERAYAAQAGLGYLGKNGMLINRQFGSWLFLAEIVTDLELQPDNAQATNHGRCGSCRLCIDACPTGAIVADGVVDSSLCLSYLTVENPSNIPESISSKIRPRLFGCDVCQDVCPHNNKHRSVMTTHDDLLPGRGERGTGVGEFLSLEQVLSITTREQFLELTAGTALTRPKLDGLRRTARMIKDSL